MWIIYFLNKLHLTEKLFPTLVLTREKEQETQEEEHLMEEKKKKKQEEKKKKEGAQKKVCSCCCFEWYIHFYWFFISVNNSGTSEQSCRLWVRLRPEALSRSSCDSSLGLPKLLTVPDVRLELPQPRHVTWVFLINVNAELTGLSDAEGTVDSEAVAHFSGVRSPASFSGLQSFNLNRPLGCG